MNIYPLFATDKFNNKILVCCAYRKLVQQIIKRKSQQGKASIPATSMHSRLQSMMDSLQRVKRLASITVVRVGFISKLWLNVNPTPPAGCCDSRAGWEAHPRHDGAGLHGASEEGPQGRHHENCWPGEAEKNVVQCHPVEISWCNKQRTWDGVFIINIAQKGKIMGIHDLTERLCFNITSEQTITEENP